MTEYMTEFMSYSMRSRHSDKALTQRNGVGDNRNDVSAECPFSSSTDKQDLNPDLWFPACASPVQATSCSPQE